MHQRSRKEGSGTPLQLLHSNNIRGLDVVLVLFDLLLQLVERDLLVFDDQVDLELLDSETHSDQLGGTPHKTVLLDGEDVGLELVHVSLVIYQAVSILNNTTMYKDGLTPGLHIQGDDRLGGRLDLAGLLLVVLGQTLRLEFLRLLVLLLVAAEQVDVIIVLLSSGCLGGVDGEVARLGAICRVVLGGVSGQGGKLRLEGQDVVVPPPRIWVLLRGGDRLDLLEDLDVGLRGGIAAVLSEMELGGKPYNEQQRERRSELRQALGFVFR